jgi:hypothetical protein
VFTDDQRKVVWGEMLDAKTRSLYFASLESRYETHGQRVTLLILLLSLGSVASLLADIPAAYHWLGRSCRRSQPRSADFCCWKGTPAKPECAHIYTHAWRSSPRTTSTSGAISTIPAPWSSGKGCKPWEGTFPRQQRSCQIRNDNCGDGKASSCEGETLPRPQLDHQPGLRPDEQRANWPPILDRWPEPPPRDPKPESPKLPEPKKEIPDK